MEEREVPVQSKRFRVINIVLYPDSRQRPENYANIFRRIYELRQRRKTYGDRWTSIRTFYQSMDTGVIHGDFSNAIFIDPDSQALDIITNEIVTSNTDPNKGLGLKTWDYWFFPEEHRIAVIAGASESQILKFLREAFLYILGDEESFQINSEKENGVVERIISATALSSLFVSISYSNNDNLDSWEAAIDQQLRDSNSRKASLKLSATKKNPIDLSKNGMAQGFVRLSASNGYAEASIVEDNGNVVTVKTEDHPVIRDIRYQNDDPTPALRQLVQSMHNRRNL